MDGTVTVASMDSVTEGGRQGVHPWMDTLPVAFMDT